MIIITTTTVMNNMLSIAPIYFIRLEHTHANTLPPKKKKIKKKKKIVQLPPRWATAGSC